MSRGPTPSWPDRLVRRLGRLLGQGGVARPAAPSAAPSIAASVATPPEGRRIVVHPGLPKTGTSSIQQAFSTNQAALLARGILYPRLETSHSRPILAAFHAGFADNARFRQMSAGEQAAYARTARAALEVEMADPGWHTLVLSGEGISRLTGAEWVALCAWLAPHAARIEVIFGLRSPVDLVRSAIQQNLKSGRTLEELYARPPTMTPRLRLEAILAALPAQAIRLWDFDAAVQSPEGLVRNFAGSIGLDAEATDLLGRTETFANPGLSQPAVEKLAARNRALAVRKPVSAAELNALTAMGGPAFRLPDEVVARLRQQAEPDLAWLRQTFGYEGLRSDQAPQRAP